MTDDIGRVITLVPLTDINVGKRYRTDMGDLDVFGEQIRDQNGLLQPVVVDVDGNLVIGARRHAAHVYLANKYPEEGWERIPTRRMDIRDVLKAEYAENVSRKDFTITERGEIYRDLLDSMSQQGARTDLYETEKQTVIVGGFGVETPDAGKTTRDGVAKALGASPHTLNVGDKVAKQGSKEVTKALNTGEITVEEAGEIIKVKDKAGQNAALGKLRDAKTAAALRKDAAKLARKKVSIARTDKERIDELFYTFERVALTRVKGINDCFAKAIKRYPEGSAIFEEAATKAFVDYGLYQDLASVVEKIMKATDVSVGK